MATRLFIVHVRARVHDANDALRASSLHHAEAFPLIFALHDVVEAFSVAEQTGHK